MTAGFLVNLHRPDAVEAARKAASRLADLGHQTGADAESAQALGLPALAIDSLTADDLILSFGGDGTLLRAAHLGSVTGVPILAVYFGSFGFVTPCGPEDMEEALTGFLAGTAEIEERMMVRTQLIRSGRIVAELHSLNEAVLQRSATARLLVFEVSVEGRRIARYPADGVLVCPPTGSTAYSLSAGGPIVEPAMQALIVTPVMPHTLAARAVVLRPETIIEISVESDREGHGGAVLSCDGMSRLHLLHGDRIQVSRSPRVVRLIQPNRPDFLEKLSWYLDAVGRGRRTS
ncbi:MAG: NAD(+)/NADH kinase [Fimbriimonadaceae bacterium]|nr:NAD(+)/NADH kinase [Fimbriimonadaceae bacterium]